MREEETYRPFFPADGTENQQGPLRNPSQKRLHLSANFRIFIPEF